MSGNTKIVVLKTKEVLWTAAMTILVITLFILLYLYFFTGKEVVPTSAVYVPGTYEEELSLGDMELAVQVTVNEDKIVSVDLCQLSEATAAMYPLLETSFSSMAEELCSTQSLDDLTVSDENRYTSLLIQKALKAALEKAKVPEEENNFSS